MSASNLPFAFARILLLSWCLTILICLAGRAQAQSVTLAWDAELNVAGYRLYSGTPSRVYTKVIDVGNTTSALVSNLVVGQTYFFAVTAYNTAGVESAPSNEISYVGGAPTPAPTPTPTPTATPTPTPVPTPTPTPSDTPTPTTTRAEQHKSEVHTHLNHVDPLL